MPRMTMAVTDLSESSDEDESGAGGDALGMLTLMAGFPMLGTPPPPPPLMKRTPQEGQFGGGVTEPFFGHLWLHLLQIQTSTKICPPGFIPPMPPGFMPPTPPGGIPPMPPGFM